MKAIKNDNLFWCIVIKQGEPNLLSIIQKLFHQEYDA
ncbi:hypothetical protein SAMN04488689_101308 [Paenibacillus sp. cl6col]|nr:hypothetical protein SAMN04488689_101308 [Paenibacillus sp. cl6col]